MRGAAAGIPAGGLALAGGCKYDTQLFLVGGTPRPRRSDDVLRYTMYAESYGREREAARLYASIDPSRTASHCATCSAPCERSCPFELPIRDEIVQAVRLLRGA